jgi:thioredoxin reductase
MGFEYAKLISNWTKDLRLCSNGKSELTPEQTQILKNHGVQIFEEQIESFENQEGYVQNIVFKNQDKLEVKAIYARPPFEQHCTIPETLGCDLNEQGLLKVDAMQKTNISGIFASGDCTTPMRSVAIAVSTGSFAGAVINKELIDEDF